MERDLTPEEYFVALREARDALNGAVAAASERNLFSCGAYTRNAHKILDGLLGGE